jgi:hypothetical protein
MITILALLTPVIEKKDVCLLQSNCVMETNAPENHVMSSLELLLMFQLIAMISTLAQTTIAALKQDALTLKLSAMTKMLVLATLVTENKDANTLQSIVMTKMLAQLIPAM